MTDFLSDTSASVTGHRGMVGSAVVRALEGAGFRSVLTRSSAELDLRDQTAVHAFFAETAPEHVFLAAARVGGIFANDVADALPFLVQHYSGESHVNVGIGQDLSNRKLAELVREVVGLEGELDVDTSKPDGTPRKLVDTSRINAMGWKAATPLRAGREEAYAWFTEHHGEAGV